MGAHTWAIKDGEAQACATRKLAWLIITLPEPIIVLLVDMTSHTYKHISVDGLRHHQREQAAVVLGVET